MVVKKLVVKNFGPFLNSEFQFSGKVNVFVGMNDTGKSIILKLIYAVIMAYRELHLPGSLSSKKYPDLLSKWLMKTFLPNSLGNLVRKGSSAGNAKAEIHFFADKFECSFSFSRKANTEIGKTNFKFDDKSNYSGDDIDEPEFFLFPPKEILGLGMAIKTTKDYEKSFPEYYRRIYDALMIERRLKPRLSGKIQKLMENIRDRMQGHLSIKENEIIFKRGQTIFEIPLVAEGYRKLGIIDLLLRAEKITNESVFLIDEPENTLNPRSSTLLTGLLYQLALSENIQIFIATHDFFVLSELQLQELEQKTLLGLGSKLFSLVHRGNKGIQVEVQPLDEPLPDDNPIVKTSMELFDRERKYIAKSK